LLSPVGCGKIGVMDESITDVLASIPKMTPIGSSNMLMELGEAVKFFPNSTRIQLGNILKSLGIPFFHHNQQVFFNLYTLEKVINYLLRAGGPGFAAPGSTLRVKQRHKEMKKPPLLQITEKNLDEMSASLITAERLATGPKGKAMRASYLAVLRRLEENMEKYEIAGRKKKEED